MTVDVQHVGSASVAREDWDITKHRSIRIADDLWERLDPAAKANGLTRSALIAQFVRWYLRVPGAALPARPARRVLLDEAERENQP